jgi:hypothetical protein
MECVNRRDGKFPADRRAALATRGAIRSLIHQRRDGAHRGLAGEDACPQPLHRFTKVDVETGVTDDAGALAV